MEKQIDTFDKLPYYCDFDKTVLVSDVIQVLTELKEEFGDIPVGSFNSGIYKNIRIIRMVSTIDGEKKIIEIS